MLIMRCLTIMIQRDPMNTRPKPFLICGPTASGKSALGMALARRTGGVIVNADALQVYDCWRVLTARPSVEDETEITHRLYGHIKRRARYSAGAWLRDVDRIFAGIADRPLIILGGTGLYFMALTQGLTDIPETPADIRTEGDKMRKRANVTEFIVYLKKHDPETLNKTDRMNAMRLQRAWEVHRATGRGLASWQKDTPPPLVPLEDSHAISLNSNVKWLNERIARRFEAMLEQGALQECEQALAEGWDPALPSSRALGAPELVAYLRGETSLEDARERATIATRQFAKRQRTWFRNKMKTWQQIKLGDKTDIEMLAERIQNGRPV